MKIKEKIETLKQRNSRQSTNESLWGLKKPGNEYNRMRASLVSQQSFDTGVIYSVRTISEANCKKWLVIPLKS